jgi:sec-independent protein translocase protein TatB
MFDLTSSKLFLLAIVALLVIGPKDFPVLLRTIGKYMGIIRGHAREFRAQFDEAMRETELSQLKKDVESIAQETEASLNATGREMEQTLNEAGKTVEASFENPLAPVSDQPHQANDGTIAADAAATVTAEPAPAAEPVASDAVAPAPAGEPQTTPEATPSSHVTPAPAHAAERTSA